MYGAIYAFVKYVILGEKPNETSENLNSTRKTSEYLENICF